jgi:catechol 2,3-dioxygenase-like lactoylglutathione lyase family enzyme
MWSAIQPPWKIYRCWLNYAKKKSDVSGIHHLALFTADMDETLRFWTSVMQARLVRAGRDPDGDPGLRHYYLDIGGSLIAFFEFPAQDKETLQFGWMHHLALRAESLEELAARKKHIEGFEVPVSEIREHDFVKSVYLHDPNGIMIEIAYPTRVLTEEDLKKDPKPVMALREMLAD